MARVFRIEDVTSGDPQKGFFARYRGQLVDDDSASLYDLLADSLAPYNIIPLFRIEDGRQVIYLAPKPPEPKKDNSFHEHHPFRADSVQRDAGWRAARRPDAQ